MQTADFLVVGGGVVGLNIALRLKERHPRAAVVLLEKEPRCGDHASTRNSGVLHAGFYYSADSLKARFAREGNRRLTEYCVERGLRINRCGKLVVARDESELDGLSELLRRAGLNGVELEEVSADDARRIESRVRTHERALYSPSTASVDPREVMDSFERDARGSGIEILTSTAYLAREKDGVRTTAGRISAGYVVNAAGLYADRIARDYGFSEDYRILPFKGLYLYAPEAGERLATNIYPVPDLRNPFLGVHFTVTAAGRTKVGPTAIPAFWREHYRGLDGFDAGELWEIASRELGLVFRSNFDFSRLAFNELRKYSRRRLLGLASELVTGLHPGRGWTWGAAGIRAQLVNIREHSLEMDFRYEADERSLHVLNAVSPAFTCAIPFSEFVADRIERAVPHGATLP